MSVLQVCTQTSVDRDSRFISKTLYTGLVQSRHGRRGATLGGAGTQEEADAQAFWAQTIDCTLAILLVCRAANITHLV